MKLLKKLLQKWHEFYGERKHQQLLILSTLLFIAAGLFLLNTNIGNSGIGNQHALAKVVCDDDYYQCGSPSWCTTHYDSSYYVHVTGYNTGQFSCGDNCYGSHVSGKCGWNDCTHIGGKCSSTQSCGSGTTHNSAGDLGCSTSGSSFETWCCVPQGCTSNCGSCQQSTYNECGDHTGGACDDGGDTHDLIVVTKNTGGVCGKYTCDKKGHVAGQCGNAAGATATPTKAPTSTPTSAPKGPTKVKLILGLPAIGGKNGGNGNPHRYVRNIKLYFYNKNDDPTDPAVEPVAIKPGKVELDKTVGSLTYGSFLNFPSSGIVLGNLQGTYKVLVKSDSYLRKQFIPKNGDSTQTYAFTGGQTTSLPKITLIAGDVSPVATPGNDTGDNVLDISDYNLLVRDCYGNKNSCPDKTNADLNDDGKIDGIDYNILIRSFKIMADEGSQGGDGE